MSLNRPRTQLTIMCRARNSASVCPGSKIQVAIQVLPSAEVISKCVAPSTARKLEGRPVPRLAAERSRVTEFEVQVALGEKPCAAPLHEGVEVAEISEYELALARRPLRTRGGRCSRSR